jgi:hypothetical protein
MLRFLKASSFWRSSKLPVNECDTPPLKLQEARKVYLRPAYYPRKRPTRFLPDLERTACGSEYTNRKGNVLEKGDILLILAHPKMGQRCWKPSGVSFSIIEIKSEHDIPAAPSIRLQGRKAGCLTIRQENTVTNENHHGESQELTRAFDRMTETRQNEGRVGLRTSSRSFGGSSRSRLLRPSCAGTSAGPVAPPTQIAGRST